MRWTERQIQDHDGAADGAPSALFQSNATCFFVLAFQSPTQPTSTTIATAKIIQKDENYNVLDLTAFGRAHAEVVLRSSIE